MTSKAKVLIKEIFIYGFGSIIGKVISVFTIPIYTRIFSESQYGIIDSITTSIAMLVIFMNLAIDMAIQRYYFLVDERQDSQKYVSTSFWFILFWGLLLTTILCFFARPVSIWLFKSGKYYDIIILAFISSFFNLIFNFCNNLQRLHFNSVGYSGFNLTKSILEVVLGLMFIIFLKTGLKGYFYGNILTFAILLVPIILSVKRDLKIFFDFSMLKSILQYSIPFVPASIAYWIFQLSDRIILARLSSLSQVGLYGVANRVVSVFPFFITAFSKAWIPRAFEMYQNNPGQFLRVLNKVHLYAATLFCFIALGLVSFSREFLIVFTTPKFYSSVNAIPFLSLSMVAHALGYIGAIGIYIKKQTNYISVFTWISAIVNVILNILLIPFMGMVATAFTTAVAYFLIYILYVNKSEELMSWKMEKARVFSVIAITCAFSLLAFYISFDKIFYSIIFKFVLCIAFLLSLVILRIIKFKELLSIYNELTTIKKEIKT